MKKGFLRWIFTNYYFYICLVIWSSIVVANGPFLSILTNLTYLAINIPVMVLFLFIPFSIVRFVLKDKNKKDFPIKSWKWIVYIIGWFGMLSLIFWVYQYLFYLYKSYGNKFFSMEFHRRTYYWGWIVITLLIIAGILYVFSILLKPISIM